MHDDDGSYCSGMIIEGNISTGVQTSYGRMVLCNVLEDFLRRVMLIKVNL